MGEDPLGTALAALRRRERSVHELEEWLRGRGFADGAIASTLDQLLEQGELDDAAFARRYAEDKRELSGWGGERIRAALVERGVAEPEIAAAVEEPVASQASRAGALLARRGDSLDSEAERARALSFLTRRGFGYEIAYEAVRARERTLSA